jgi:serine phosphatase RsbU (regulator of sigma subunit)
MLYNLWGDANAGPSRGDLMASDQPESANRDEGVFVVGPAIESGSAPFEIPPGSESGIAGEEDAGRLLRHLRHREEEFTRLIQITERINYGVSLDDVLEFIYREMRPVIPYDRISVALVDESRGMAVSHWCRSDRDMILKAGYEAPLKGSSLEQVLATGKPRIINDLEGYLLGKPQSDSTRLIVQEGMRSSLTCPLTVQGRPVGFMFFSSAGKGTYSNVHVRFFQQVAGLLSGFVEKGRLYSELAAQKALIERQNKMMTDDLETARQVQRTLIHRQTPEIKGLQIALDYEPAIQIGGDLLDVIPLADGQVLFFVGDAMGHGVQAALVMAVAKTALQSAVQADHRPAVVLANLNQVICGLTIEPFVTAACCVMDPLSGRTELALAGHPLPFHFQIGASEVVQWGITALPLGLDRRAKFESDSMQLRPGDGLVLFTDGVVDMSDSDGHRYGYDRLKEQVLAHGRLSADRLLAAIRQDMAVFSAGHPMDDDVAFLAVKRTGFGV